MNKAIPEKTTKGIALPYGLYGEAYQQLIDYAIDHSDAFMLVYFNLNAKGMPLWYRSRMIDVRQHLACHRICSRNDLGNASQVILGGPVEITDPETYVDFYRTTKNVRNFLYDPNDFYAWHPPLYPEGLNFFRKGFCWFGLRRLETAPRGNTRERLAQVIRPILWPQNADDDEFIERIVKPTNPCHLVTNNPYYETYPFCIS